eukprot:CAMPEP_0196819702 /NCGR_PEP_ID=MMETSP1362-20130617/71801_1 /TAXON_ID=163516 /ORGANISM="Leptocylindrus danicus, Strain CCMP1856" /LENGTH=500 /DNA_ID=CAMNT_0042198283 /DNA_START=23 /DNA_END=1525 /DNA_ORIENTATION=-
MQLNQAATLLSCLISTSSAFTSVGRRPVSRLASVRRFVATTPDAVDNSVSPNRSEPTTWECDDDLTECKEVPACNEVECRTSLDVRIHDTWYDLTGWRKAHPAGTHWIDWYDGRDATEVMDAFHSEKARGMWDRLPKSKPEAVKILDEEVPATSKASIAFRELRDQLEKDGWWERDIKHEITLLGIWGGLVAGAIATAHTVAPLSIFLTALAMTNAGWLGHDYVHGVDKWCDRMRYFVCYGAGLGVTWWSDKHNKHHALTNEQGVDEDIATDPFLYTWAPDPEHDSPLRKIQHWIFWIPFSALFALWRVDTLNVVVNAIEEKRPNAKQELFLLLAHYFVMLSVLPFNVWFPAVFLSGFMSAMIVTPTHQSEEFFSEFQHDWVTAQFTSTRNGVMTNPFSEWLWGGMQYQLEHHLFPSMPRSKYPLLKPILQKFAEENNIPGGYRESGEFEILKMNWELYKRVAEADAVPGAPYSRGHGQLGAIDLGFSPAAGGFKGRAGD